jgi:hypothetical protein
MKNIKKRKRYFKREKNSIICIKHPIGDQLLVKINQDKDGMP